MDYVDTDIVIQHLEGKLLQEIFDSDGYSKIYADRRKIVLELQLENSIISKGGSVIYSKKAMTIHS